MPTGQLIAEVASAIDGYLVMPSRAATLAVSLFALHTWAFAAAHSTPYLIVWSPTKRSGKSRFEEVLERLVRSPWRIAAASEAAMFRKIAADQPTILMDEVDALFGRAAESNEAIRAVLNAGNRPGAAVSRCVDTPDGVEVVDFPVYCPKVLAGIHTSRWPDTVVHRGIPISMQRKKPGQSVRRLRYRTLVAETEYLRGWLERWGQEHVETLRDFEPELPSGLDDRAADSWECLFAIAALADRESNGGWVERTRTAALKLSGGGVEDDEHGVLFLRAVRTLIGDADAIQTATIIEKVNADEQLPFGEYRMGQGLTAHSVAKLLRPFAIRPHNVSADTGQAKGYRREQFLDAWSRYCAAEPAENTSRGQDCDFGPSTRPDSSGDGRFGDFANRPEEGGWTDTKTPENPDVDGLLDGWTVTNVETRPVDVCDRHPGQEWRVADGGVWTCGVCHPPAAGLEVERGHRLAAVEDRGKDS
jgi:hypothetical protein